MTAYVQGRVYYVQENYTAAGTAFQEALGPADTYTLLRRCYIGLGDVYRDCAALARLGTSPIQNPASKSAGPLSAGITQNALRYDTTLWEMLAMAYFEAYHTDASVPGDYLSRAADCFNRVIEPGRMKDYLYSNLYTIYYLPAAWDFDR